MWSYVSNRKLFVRLSTPQCRKRQREYCFHNKRTPYLLHFQFIVQLVPLKMRCKCAETKKVYNRWCVIVFGMTTARLFVITIMIVIFKDGVFLERRDPSSGQMGRGCVDNGSEAVVPSIKWEFVTATKHMVSYLPPK